MCKHSFHQRCLDTAGVAASTTRDTNERNSRPRRRGRGIAHHSDAQRINDDHDNDNDASDGSDEEEEEEGEENSDDDIDDINDIECPVCAPQNATVRAIRRAQAESAHRHDMFLDVLGRSKDGFGTVSEWFGRGVMNK